MRIDVIEISNKELDSIDDEELLKEEKEHIQIMIRDNTIFFHKVTITIVVGFFAIIAFYLKYVLGTNMAERTEFGWVVAGSILFTVLTNLSILRERTRLIDRKMRIYNNLKTLKKGEPIEEPLSRFNKILNKLSGVFKKLKKWIINQKIV